MFSSLLSCPLSAYLLSCKVTYSKSRVQRSGVCNQDVSSQDVRSLDIYYLPIKYTPKEDIATAFFCRLYSYSVFWQFSTHKKYFSGFPGGRPSGWARSSVCGCSREARPCSWVRSPGSPRPPSSGHGVVTPWRPGTGPGPRPTMTSRLAACAWWSLTSAPGTRETTCAGLTIHTGTPPAPSRSVSG